MLPPLLPPSLSKSVVRVAHMVRPATGGMRAQVHSLLTAFPSSLLAAPQDVCDFCADVVAGGDILPLLAVRRPDQLFLAGLRAGKWAKARGAHLLHGHGLLWLPLFATAQSVSGLPLVVTLHNMVPNNLNAAQKLVLCAALSRADRIICVSEAVAASAKVIKSSHKGTVIRNGIDTARFDTPLRPDARASLGLFPDDFAVVCVARLSREKGLKALLLAADLLSKESPLRIFIAGDGPQLAELKQITHEKNLQKSVTFLGKREDIATLLRAADLYVQPSLSEGLGLAVLEAMASGLPVVATRTGGLPEVVVDKVTGLLIPPNDAAALAGAIASLLFDTNRRDGMKRAGRERAFSCFGIGRMVSETRTVYEAAFASYRGEGRP